MASIGSRLAMAVLLGSNVLACTGDVRPLEGILVIVFSPEACGVPNGDLGPLDNCGRLTIIESTGLVRVSLARGPANLGVLSSEVLSTLKAAIETTDFEELRAQPWEGVCAETDEDADWKLVSYEFFATDGQQRVAVCGNEIDRGHPLFVALRDALRVVGQPLP
jgi:hypothetical protein